MEGLYARGTFGWTGATMRDFTVNVVPNEEGRKIPVFLAGQVMVDIQQILMDVGEYLTSRALRVQKTMKKGLISRFLLYMTPEGGISIDTSADLPEVGEFGNIVDDAIQLTEGTMEAMGSGAGGYWMEDNYADPFYRRHIIYDLAALDQHLSAFPEYSLMFGPSDNPKKFGHVDMMRLAAFLDEKGDVGTGAVIGILNASVSKSKGTRLSLLCGDDRVKLSFADKASEDAALTLVDKGPVIIGGQTVVDGDGNLLEIRQAGGVKAADSIQFNRLVASNGDVKLSNPVKVTIRYSPGSWTLRNEETGISVTHPTWDESVQAFHDQMVFLWTQYSDPERELEGEEAEIRDYLRGLSL